jgi:hypothetical protein
MMKSLSLLALIVALALAHHALRQGEEGVPIGSGHASGLSVAAVLSPCAGSAPGPPSP